jgi:ABC-type Fe3+ transport system substrate-binding protein
MKVRMLGAVFAACLSLSGVARAQDAEWDQVIAAAKKEGSVVVYNAGLGVPLYEAVAREFEKTYGIKVETIVGRGSEITERIRAEHTAGRFVGDLQLHAESVIVQQQTQGDFVQDLPSIPNGKTLRAPFSATRISMPIYTQAYGILVNTALVKPEDEPKSWTDLLDPKWKGKILADDMRPIGAGNGLFTVLYKAYGASFHEKLAAQALTFSRDPANDARRVARGEYPIYIPQVYAIVSTFAGLPVKALIPAEGVAYSSMDFAVLKKATHPNAARLMINYFLEAKSQLVYAEGWMPPVADGVIDKATAAARPYAGVKLLGTSKPDEREEMAALARKYYANY